MKKILFVSALVLAAACGGKSSSSTTTDPCKDPCKDKVAAMDCAGMGQKIEAAMNAEGEMGADVAAEMSGMIVGECNEMAWSQETIDCMAAATSEETAESCEATMTDEQKTHMMETMNAAMGGGGMEDESTEGME